MQLCCIYMYNIPHTFARSVLLPVSLHIYLSACLPALGYCDCFNANGMCTCTQSRARNNSMQCAAVGLMQTSFCTFTVDGSIALTLVPHKSSMVQYPAERNGNAESSGAYTCIYRHSLAVVGIMSVGALVVTADWGLHSTTTSCFIAQLPSLSGT